VAVIDDEPSVARALERALPGHRVVTYSGVDEALRALVEGPLPDVVLCDVMMPGLSGVDVVEQLSARRPEALARVVLMTGGSYTPRVERFLETARFKVLPKPFEAGEVLAVLAEATGV
jgi:CheY-like chemotaxis protein